MRLRLAAARVFGLVACLVLAAFAPASPAKGRNVLGRLGQAVRTVGIHAGASPRSRVLSRVKTNQYIVVNSSRARGWLSVVLRDGRHGFVPADTVTPLPYLVVRATAKTSAPAALASCPLASRTGGWAGDFDGRAKVADDALLYQGTPYKWGGNNLVKGIDCSGFVKQLFGQIGVNLPRTAAQQVNVGIHIYRLQDLQKGDRLYFWDAKRGKIGHTGIYLGNGYFVHSSSGRKGVATSLLTKSWQRILCAATR